MTLKPLLQTGMRRVALADERKMGGCQKGALGVHEHSLNKNKLKNKYINTNVSAGGSCLAFEMMLHTRSIRPSDFVTVMVDDLHDIYKHDVKISTKCVNKNNNNHTQL